MNKIRSLKSAKTMYKVFIYTLILSLSVLMLAPFFWLISCSLKTSEEIFEDPPVWIPKPAHFENFPNAWNSLPFAKFLGNTLLITFGRLTGALASCTLVAFGFSRLRARGSNLLFLILLSTMMLPPQVSMIPMYIFYSKIHWVDTFKPLIIPSYFGGAFFVFMMRQFFMQIPHALDEAAKIDGASTFTIYHTIFLPLAKAPMIALGIFVTMAAWNDFIGPLIYLHNLDNYTLALGLQMFKSYGEFATRWDLIMAASTFLALPPVILFFLAQKQFISGVALTGIKG
jgi:multiple sugar transport system permease protein